MKQTTHATEKRTFLNEWTPEQFRGMERKIRHHFAPRQINIFKNNIKTNFVRFNRTFKRLNEIMGFAYTSSSSYAGYWVCNAEVESNDHPGYKYIGFALGTNRKAYAILWDKDENEIILPI